LPEKKENEKWKRQQNPKEGLCDATKQKNEQQVWASSKNLGGETLEKY